ncbi:MAG: hypothetical protein P4L55_11450 [Syntrophobacteraceae bacterium]|nr:hypothetical protein [Syntrophobacteraceae bacterium]
MIDPQGRIVIANTAFCRLMCVDEDKVFGRNALAADSGTPDQSFIKKALEKGWDFHNMPIPIDFPKGKKYFVARGQRMPFPEDQPIRILLRFEQEPAKGHDDVQ